MEGEKDLEGKSVRTLKWATYLTPFLLPEDGGWRVSFGLTLERHVFSRSCCLVLRLSHKLWWDWEGERQKKELGLSSREIQSWLTRAGIHLFLAQISLVLFLPPDASHVIYSYLLFCPLSPFPSNATLHITLQADPGEALTVNTEGAGRLRTAHAVLCHTGVGPLIFRAHVADPKAVVTPNLIPAPLPTPSWVGHSYKPRLSPPEQTTRVKIGRAGLK